MYNLSQNLGLEGWSFYLMFVQRLAALSVSGPKGGNPVFVVFLVLSMLMLG
jgi:hypothetical protein